MPHTAAGWRMEPPVSVPIPSGASYAATAADDPPDEPPGTRVRSHGLAEGPNAEFSVDEPMANSSMLVFPRMITPASLSRLVTVASYGGRQPSRIFDPQVVGMSLVVSTSLSASGTPPSGPSGSPAARLRSTSSAAASAPTPATCRNACRRGSTATIRSRCAWVTSTADTSPEATAAASSAAVSRMSSGASAVISVLRQYARDPESGLFRRGRAGECLFRRELGSRDVFPVHVDDGNGMRHRRDLVGRDLLHARHGPDDLIELAGEVLELGVGQRQPGKPGQVSYLVPRNGHARHPRRPGRTGPKAIRRTDAG